MHSVALSKWSQYLFQPICFTTTSVLGTMTFTVLLPLLPRSMHVTATLTLQLSTEPLSVMTYQACRPPRFPAGLNGAENRKKTNQQR